MAFALELERTSTPFPEPAAAQPVIELRGVSKRYGEKEAVSGVDLDVRAGEIVGFLGRNGAGKTTLISIMLGLRSPTSGTVRVFGGAPAAPSVRARLGAMLQESGVPMTLTVGEVVDLFRHYYPHALPAARVIAAAGLGGLVKVRVKDLSGGQRQRLYFALAMSGDPDLLFLDEPTTGMDIESRRNFWAHVRDIAAVGKTVLFATHILEEADALATRVVVIDRGRIALDGTPAQLKSRSLGKRVRIRGDVTGAEAAAWPGVRRVEEVGGYLVVQTAEPESVLRRLFTEQRRLDEVTVDDAELESAFLDILSGEENR